MNETAKVKRDLIAGLDQGRTPSRAFVETLAPTLPVHAGSDWTLRDLIIHLTALEADMITALRCAIQSADFAVDLRGQASVPDLYELRRRDQTQTSWQALLTEWDRIRDRLRGVVLAFPADMMQIRFSTPFFEDYNLAEAVYACATHEGLHLAEVRAAVRRLC